MFLRFFTQIHCLYLSFVRFIGKEKLPEIKKLGITVTGPVMVTTIILFLFHLGNPDGAFQVIANG